jgi:uncharacterized Zn-binding protein involved in type VI secretion
MGSVGIHPPKSPVTKGSTSVSAATLPNICKMPGPPAPFVPTPLPNIGKSSSSPKGYSKEVKIEGNAVAIQGASFGSMGDVASKGLGGGMVSMNCEGPTKFIAPGSLTVKIEGKNVHLLSDVMSNNNGPSGSPPNSATMMGTVHSPAAIANLIKALCQIINQCENEVNSAKFGPGNKPTKEWCRAPGSDPSKTNAMEIGEEKAKCAENKVNQRKAKSDTPLSKDVQAEKYVPVPGGGWCKPDVMVGTPPSCQAVFDFKTSCPLTPSSKASWPIYGPGGRTAPNPSYNGKTQAAIYKDACGVQPVIIHPNSEACKS